MERIFLINSLTFLSLGLLIFWKLTDPRPFKEKASSYFSIKGILIGVYTIIFFTLNYLSGVYLPLPKFGGDEILVWFGIITFFLGLGLSAWAKIIMGKSWGIPAEHNKVRQNQLIRNGPFRYSRNPIYVGLIMVLIGYGIAVQSYFTFLALVPIFYFRQSAKKEEILLEKIFKEEYLKYRKEVPELF